jgi:NADH dehydrogenase/NADH:ubiquinone oxidoreductase subunit G
MATTNIFRPASQALARLDIAPTREAIDSLQAEIIRLERGYTDGRERQRELTRLVNDRAEHGPDGDEAADAILAGHDVTEAAAEIDNLKAQREAVRAGNGVIEGRIREAKAALLKAREEFRTPLGAAVDLAAEAIEEEAEAIAVRLAELYAATEGANLSARAPKMRGLAMRLRASLHELAIAEFVDRRALDLPADATAMLEAAHEAIVTAGGKIPERVLFPWVDRSGAVSAAFEQGRARQAKRKAA